MRTAIKSLGIGLAALLTALRYPRVWLALWAWVTVAALALVVPIYNAIDAALAHHPGASRLVDQALDDDFWRQNAPPHITGALVFVLLGMVFFAGGILGCLGVGQRFRFTGFLSECARLFPRNLRVLLIGFVPAVLLFWGVGFVDTWLREDLLRNWDPGGPDLDSTVARYVSLEFGLELLNWFWGLLFLLLVLTSKVAMAHLAVENRSLALWAWVKAAKRVLTSPFLASCIILFLSLAYVPLYFLGGVITHFLEAGPETNLLAGLACGQGAIMWLQVVTVAFFLAARKFLMVTAPPSLQKTPAATPAEPVVVIPRQPEPVPAPEPARSPQPAARLKR
jgi:hypothetical protein